MKHTVTIGANQSQVFNLGNSAFDMQRTNGLRVVCFNKIFGSMYLAKQ
jgi:hypothetical protein